MKEHCWVVVLLFVRVRRPAGLLKALPFDLLWSVFFIPAGYPSLRIEKNDLRSVTLLEAKAKVKDIAISRERVTLRDVLHEGACFLLFSLILSSLTPSL